MKTKNPKTTQAIQDFTKVSEYLRLIDKLKSYVNKYKKYIPFINQSTTLLEREKNEFVKKFYTIKYYLLSIEENKQFIYSSNFFNVMNTALTNNISINLNMYGINDEEIKKIEHYISCIEEYIDDFYKNLEKYIKNYIGITEEYLKENDYAYHYDPDCSKIEIAEFVAKENYVLVKTYSFDNINEECSVWIHDENIQFDEIKPENTWIYEEYKRRFPENFI